MSGRTDSGLSGNGADFSVRADGDLSLSRRRVRDSTRDSDNRCEHQAPPFEK